MGKKLKWNIISLLLVCFIVLGSIQTVSALEDLGTYKQGEDVRIAQVCSDSTYINISSITYPNGTAAVSNIGMTSAGSGEYYYVFNYTDLKGRYDVRGISDGCEETFATYFTITHLGKELSSAGATMYIGFLALLVLIFFLNFFGMGFLPSKNNRDEEGRLLSINYLKYFRNVLWMTGYFLFIAITFVASNLAFAFLEEEMFANILFTIFKVSFGLAPVIVIVWLIWIFVSMFHDRQFQKMLNRGFFPGSNNW